MSHTTDDSKHRIDKWLWAARFFKTRRLATDAISGGHVHLNGSRVKPSRPLKLGDRLRIRKGAQHWEVEVLILEKRRGPASAAALLYQETEQSQQARAEHAAKQRELAQQTSPSRRPNKRARQQIHRFKRAQS